MALRTPSVNAVLLLADAFVQQNEPALLAEYEKSSEALFDDDWEKFKRVFGAKRSLAADDDLAKLYPNVDADVARRRLDSIARGINRWHVQRYAVWFLETGIPGYYGEFERLSTQLSDDEWVDLKERLDQNVASASDADLAQRFPDVDARVVRNRMDNVARLIEEQQKQRDAGTLVVYKEPDYGDLFADPSEQKPTVARVSRPAAAAAQKEKPETPSGFFSSVGNILFLIGGIALALFVTLFVTIAVIYIYQKLERRGRQRATQEKMQSEFTDTVQNVFASSPMRV